MSYEGKGAREWSGNEVKFNSFTVAVRVTWTNATRHSHVSRRVALVATRWINLQFIVDSF